jgi:(p)ppGpp synthase/HD superfamily hydrolase
MGDPLFYSALIDRAVEFAAIAHRDQLRKSPELEIPYIQHTVMVGLILQRAGYSEEVVAAGVLHDVLEDTEVSLVMLQEEFGPRVADLVNSVSEQDKSLPWEERKERYLRHLETAGDESKAITASDKIHNINSILVSLKRGADIWCVFKRGREAQLDRFRRLLKTLKSNWSSPLLLELEEVVERLTHAG